MRIFKKGSRGQGIKVPREMESLRGVPRYYRGTTWQSQKSGLLRLWLAMTGWILLFFFNFSLLTFNFSLAHAVSLSDIKLDALDKPIKEKWGRDPFIRYGDKIAKLRGKTFGEDTLAGLRITGIISDGKKAVAIINGGFYRKNEKVNDFLIVDIAKDKISLEKNGKRFYLGVEKFTMDTYKEKDKKDDKGKDKKEDKEAKE